MKIDGQKIRDEILSGLNFASGKFLVAVMIGENPTSSKFLEEKRKIAERLKVDFKLVSLPEDIADTKLKEEIKKMGDEDGCGGVLVQLPLPSGLDASGVLAAIPAEKDVDLLSGHSSLVIPPSVGVVEEIFMRQGVRAEEKTIAVLGLGFLTGKPISSRLKDKAKELIILDKGDDLEPISRADIVISGVGKPKLFSAKQLLPGAGIIDFGVSFQAGKVVGDFDPEGDLSRLSFYTPTPGGTGPILIAKLFQNFSVLTQRKNPPS